MSTDQVSVPTGASSQSLFNPIAPLSFSFRLQFREFVVRVDADRRRAAYKVIHNAANVAHCWFVGNARSR